MRRTLTPDIEVPLPPMPERLTPVARESDVPLPPMPLADVPLPPIPL